MPSSDQAIPTSSVIARGSPAEAHSRKQTAGGLQNYYDNRLVPFSVQPRAAGILIKCRIASSTKPEPAGSPGRVKVNAR